MNTPLLTSRYFQTIAAFVFSALITQTTAQISWSRWAGGSGGRGYMDGAAADARFDNPGQAVFAPNGDMIVADTYNHVIRKISTAGVVTTLAGMAGQPGHQDGPGATARFQYPNSVAVNANNEIFVADTNNYVIRKISPTGDVTTFAGKVGISSANPINATGTDATFSRPTVLKFFPDGSLAVADATQLRKITIDAVVSVIAGGPSSQSVDGIGTEAKFAPINDLHIDSLGVIFLTENRTVRKILPDGTVTTLAGLASTAGSVDGLGSAAQFRFAQGLTQDAVGNLLVADGRSVRKVSLQGLVETIPGLTLYPNPGLFTRAPSGAYVYCSDAAIFSTDLSANQTSIAGLENIGSNDGLAEDARFYQPDGIAVDKNGNVYVSDRENVTIRKITPAGVVTTLAGQVGQYGYVDGPGSTALFGYPRGLCVDDLGNVYVADMTNNAIRKITPQGMVSTHSVVTRPADVVRDSKGNVFAASFETNDTVKRNQLSYYGNSISLISNGTITNPVALAMGVQDRLFVLNYAGQNIHQVWPNSIGAVLAGMTGVRGSNDGFGENARFSFPVGIAADLDNNVYVADTGNDLIRKVTSTGMVSTIGANESHGALVPGIGRFDSFADPTSIAVGPDRTIYVANKLHHNIVKGVMAGPEIRLSNATNGGLPLDTPAKITMHPSSVGYPTKTTIVIENRGSAPLTGIALSISGTDASDYSIGSYPNEIAAGSHADVTITCQSNVAKTSLATVTIASSDVDESTSTIAFNAAIHPATPVGDYAWNRYTGFFNQAGYADAPLTTALPLANSRISFSAAGEMYLVQSNIHCIRKIDQAGLIQNVAGFAGTSGNTNGLANSAKFIALSDIAVSKQGVVYVAENGSSRRIRILSPSGLVSTALSTIGQTAPVAIYYDELHQRLLISDETRDVIQSLAADGSFTVFAGISGTAGNTNGTTSTSTFSNPNGIAMDTSGNIFVCDSANQVIRKITPSGVVSTHAGQMGVSGSDDGPAATATFHLPHDIVSTSDGSLIVTCTGSHTVRKISPTGMVSTIGGMATVSGNVSGLGTAARFTTPRSLGMDPDGRLYVATASHIMQSTRVGTDLSVLAIEGEPLTTTEPVKFYSLYPGSSSQTFVCKNVGTMPYPSLVSKISGLHANRFSVTSALSGAGLAPGAIDAFTIKYQPLSSASGSATLKLALTTLAAAEKQYTLSGNVLDSMSLWRQESFGDVSITSTSQHDADPDADGLPNLLEYAFGLNPLLAETTYAVPAAVAGLPVATTIASNDGPRLQLSFVRRRAASAPGISYVAEFSASLSQEWTSSTNAPLITPIDEQWERVTIEDSSSEGQTRRFGRVRVIAP